MADFKKLKTTLAYARLGLISLSATVVPINAVAQELCGTDVFEGQPDEAFLMAQTMEFFDILEGNGIVSFEGAEGRMSIESARQALQDGVGSAILLSCVLSSSSIEFTGNSENVIVACNSSGLPTPFRFQRREGSNSGQLFCRTEFAAYSRYLGSEA